MKPTKPISPFRLASLLRLEKDPKLALQLFQNPNPPPKSPLKPFRYSLLCYDLIITKLGRAKLFKELQIILLQLQSETRFVPTEIIFCNVINFYGRAGLWDHARKVFDEMPKFRCQRTLKSYNSLLNVYVKSKDFDRIKELLGDIENSVKPDACTYNILVRSLCENGNIVFAWDIFLSMIKRGINPNQVTFVTLIHGFCSELNLKKALELKNEMYKVYKVSANARVYASLIKGFCSLGDISSAFKLKEEMVKRKIEMDSAIYSTLISGLYKVGRKDEVSVILEEMKSKGCKMDTVTYNVMISGLCKDQDFETAYGVLDEMVQQGCKPDVISYNVILGELCKAGKLSEASDLFEDMPRRGCSPDVLTYRIFFDGLCEAMQFKDASLLLDEMVFKGFTPCFTSRCRLVSELCKAKNQDLLWLVLNSLGRLNAIDVDVWRMAASLLLKDDTSSCIVYNLIA